jgi:hypothetical protein
MPATLCTVCEQPGWFRATKGARLADCRCTCGGVLRLARRSTPRPAGRVLRTCAVCGANKFTGIVELLKAMTFRKSWRHGKRRRVMITLLEDAQPNVLPAGSYICGVHDPVEADDMRQRHDDEKDAFLHSLKGRSMEIDTTDGRGWDAMVARQVAEIDTFMVSWRRVPDDAPAPAKT